MSSSEVKHLVKRFATLRAVDRKAVLDRLTLTERGKLLDALRPAPKPVPKSPPCSGDMMRELKSLLARKDALAPSARACVERTLDLSSSGAG